MGLVHGSTIEVDGDGYRLMVAPDAPNGELDILGLRNSMRECSVSRRTPWCWSSDVPDGEYVCTAHGVVDTWSQNKAGQPVVRFPAVVRGGLTQVSGSPSYAGQTGPCARWVGPTLRLGLRPGESPACLI